MAVEIVREYYLLPDPVHNGRISIHQPIPLELNANGQNGYHSFTLEFHYKPVRLRSGKEVTYGHKVTAYDLASAEEEMVQKIASDYRWAICCKVTLPYLKDDPFIKNVKDTLTPFFKSPTD